MVLDRGSLRYQNIYWADEAACRHHPGEYFFGNGKHPLSGRNADQGREVCLGCTVRRDCLLDALKLNETEGMRGAFLPHEREATMEKVGWVVREAMGLFDDGAFHPIPRRSSAKA